MSKGLQFMIFLFFCDVTRVLTNKKKQGRLRVANSIPIRCHLIVSVAPAKIAKEATKITYILVDFSVTKKLQNFD